MNYYFVGFTTELDGEQIYENISKADPSYIDDLSLGFAVSENHTGFFPTITEARDAIAKADKVFLLPNFTDVTYIELGIAIAFRKEIFIVGKEETFRFDEYFPMYNGYMVKYVLPSQISQLL